MARIDVVKLHHRYPTGVDALNGIDISIENEAVAIIGQNGAGKTTLVKHLNGLLKPTTGKVTVDGLDTRQRTVAQLARKVGLVFQNPANQIFNSSVGDEVAFGPRNMGYDDSKVKHLVKESLSRVGLLEALGIHPYELSPSERKLVCIASVVAMDTPVVVLDEPTTGQDHHGTIKISELVRSMRADGKTVITITHDMEFVAECFPRTVVMRRGAVMLDGATEWVFSQVDTLADAWVSPPLLTSLGQRLGIEGTMLTVADFERYVCSKVGKEK